MHPLITIAIPTYNRGTTYLRQTLVSALRQTYQNIEIVISDNCSTDNTEDVVKAFNDPRIRYFRQSSNIGHTNNYNFCVEQARGVYLLLLHDDDLIDHDFVDVCLKVVNYSFVDVGVIRTGTRWIDSEDGLLKEIPNKACGVSTDNFFKIYFSAGLGCYLCSTLFNTARLREIGGFHSTYHLFEDVMATMKLAAIYGKQDIYDMKASNRKHSSEMTWGTKVESWCNESMDLIDLMCELTPENHEIIRADGMRALSNYVYSLTSKIKSPLIRFWTYIRVYKMFNYSHFPPPVGRLVYHNNPFSRGARYLRRRIKPIV